MKAHLLYKDRDFDWQIVRSAVEVREADRRGWGRRDATYFDPHAGLPWNDEELSADLSLETVFEAMANKDDCIYETSKRVILLGASEGDSEGIHYRQAILEDCLKHEAVIRELYKLAGSALDKRRNHYISDYTRSHPDAMLRESISMLEELFASLQGLHEIAEKQGGSFVSEGWRQFFTMLETNLGTEYLDEVKHHLKQLEARRDVLLMSAGLGVANTGTDYLLHEAPQRDHSLWARSKALLTHHEPVYSFRLSPRDEAGSQALNELRDRGIGQVAGAVGQSAENVADFFEMLRVETAFYIGCMNLRKKLVRKNNPVCMPEVVSGTLHFSCKSLYDAGLALSVSSKVVGNDIKADDKNLVIITGTNTGGKSTFLRSIGIAQLLMQCGMFVPAAAFRANVADGIFTHYKREEDTGMNSGKFDEELRRMSAIVDHIKPGALMLFNESFAATNEREGSEIARQIITALIKKRIRIFCVTHLYELAHGFYQTNKNSALFLQAGRSPTGKHTFKMVEGEPLPSSHGEDLYKRIFNTHKGDVHESNPNHSRANNHKPAENLRTR